MAERRTVLGVMATPVEDHPAETGVLSFDWRLYGNAYDTRRRIFGAESQEPNMREIPNKCRIADVQVEEGGRALLFSVVHGDMRTPHRLEMPGNEEGFGDVFPREPRTHEEMRHGLAPQTFVGGNATNSVLNSLLLLRALGATEKDLELLNLMPGRSPLQQRLESEKLMKVVPTDLASRWSLHLRNVIFHEGHREQTFMMGLQGSPRGDVREELIRHGGALSQLPLLVAEDDFPEVTNGMPVLLIPGSTAMEHVTLRPGMIPCINDQELQVLLQRSGYPVQLAGDEQLLPSTLHRSTEALRTSNARLRMLLDQVVPGNGEVGPTGRLASIGKQDGNGIEVFLFNGKPVAVETSRAEGLHEEGLVHAAESDGIRIDVKNAAGRGDAASSAVVLEQIAASVPHLLESVSGRCPPQKQQLFRMVFLSVLGRSLATMVYRCPQSNLFGALDEAGMRRVLEMCAQCTNRMLENSAASPITPEPRHFEDRLTGMHAAIWEIPRVVRTGDAA